MDYKMECNVFNFILIMIQLIIQVIFKKNSIFNVSIPIYIFFKEEFAKLLVDSFDFVTIFNKQLRLI